MSLASFRAGALAHFAPFTGESWQPSSISTVGWLGRLGLVCALLGLIGCAAGKPAADLAMIYTPGAKWHAPDRNPIIVIPGILGSRLVAKGSGEVVWGAFDLSSADPAKSAGARLLALSLEELEPDDVATSRREVVVDGVLDRIVVRLLGLPIELQAYAGILATLGAGGYRDQSLGLGGGVDYGDDHFTCFQFAYDWRRDNVENAQRLAAFVQEKKTYVREQYRERFGIDRPDLKFDIVAHSMGSLLTRYYLMYGDAPLPHVGPTPEPTWAGAANVERVVLVGPPNHGSADSILQLVQGRRFSRALPTYPPALIGTFTSVYQLLPRSRHHPLAVFVEGGTVAAAQPDLFDADLWVRKGWGLAAPGGDQTLAALLPGVSDPAERRRKAVAALRRNLDRARAFTEALDQPAVLPPGLEFMIVAGDADSTPVSVAETASGKLAVAKHGPGDGVVSRASALADERADGRWIPTLRSSLSTSRTLLLPAEHLRLTRHPVFRDNVLFWLLEEPRSPRPTLH